MSTLSQFGGSAPTRSIVNAFSSGGVSAVTAPGPISYAREVLSGALTANTLKTVLSVTQGGQCPFLTAYTKNATSRTVRLVVKVDGVTVFDATSNTLTATSRGLLAAGSLGWDGSNNTMRQGHAIRWNGSLEVQVASTLTETDNVAIAYELT